MIFIEGKFKVRPLHGAKTLSKIIQCQSTKHQKNENQRYIVAKILRRMIERKIEDVFGEDQFGFRRGKGTGDAIGMLIMISERTLERDEKRCVCFID